MANVDHKDLTDPQLHEPKGVAGAAEGTVYVTDGEGSGTHESVSNLIGTGWACYESTLGTFTVTDFTSLGQVVENDASGTGTTETYLPADVDTSWWDTSSNKFNPSKVGDVYIIQLGLTVAETSSFGYAVVEIESNSILLADHVIESKRGVGETFNVHYPVTADESMVDQGISIRVYKDLDASTVVLDDFKITIIRVSKGVEV